MVEAALLKELAAQKTELGRLAQAESLNNPSHKLDCDRSLAKPESASEVSNGDKPWWKNDASENAKVDYDQSLASRNEVGEADEVSQLNTRNSFLEGQTHPETGVPFERKTVTQLDGTKAEGVFPQFDSVIDVKLPEDLYQASDAKQFDYCNRQLKARCESDPKFREQFSDRQLAYIDSGRTPSGYTWHHNEETGKMQLVNYEQHWKTGHTGGQSVWGGGSENR